jgi:hypothetical protein
VSNLAVDNPDNTVALADAGIIPPLVAALTRHADNADVLTAARGAVSNLATDADTKVACVSQLREVLRRTAGTKIGSEIKGLIKLIDR